MRLNAEVRHSLDWAERMYKRRKVLVRRGCDDRTLRNVDLMIVHHLKVIGETAKYGRV